ncbi:MAG: SO_0444 family Cu/Zn efflux transporter [Pirellulaceae bacterium]|nr:SO_0444 family Cu/Zn efflux transporter [Pirellulaceae bacterium]
MYTFLIKFLDALWYFTLELSPWLVLGLVAAGLLKVFMPMALVSKVLGKEGFLSSLWAALIGVPLPLCSCSVLPVAVGLRKQGASRSAVISFLISTPQTGVDSLAVSYAFLGPVVTIFRPICAVFSALTIGTLVYLLERCFPKILPPQTSPDPDSSNTSNESSCHSPAPSPLLPILNTPPQADTLPPKTESCCITDSSAKKPQTLMQNFSTIGRYAFGTLLDDLLFWLVVGLVLAALIQVLLPPESVQHLSGIWAMLALLLIGIPMYVCATSSTLIAASLLAASVSPGAVVLFLLAGPATNVSTFGILQQELGRRIALVSVFALMVISLILGLGIDFLVEWWNLPINSIVQNRHDHPIYWVNYACFAVLVLAVFSLKYPLFKNYWKKWATFKS